VLVPSQRIVALFRALFAGGPAPAAPPPREAGSFVDRVIVFFAAAICLLFAATLRDAGPRRPTVPAVAASAALPGDSTLVAHVVDAEGHPYDGAVVRVFSVSNDGRVFFAGEKLHAGAEVRWDALPSGEVWVVAYGAGHTRASTRVVLVGTTPREVTLALAPASALSVKVVDETGAPVDSAVVSVQSTDPLPNLARTDGEGRATLDRLGPAPWNVTALATGYDPVTRSGIYPGAPLEIRLERLGGFEVTVLDVDQEPAPFAEIWISGPGVWPARMTQADAAGHARIVGLNAGVFDLKARLGDKVSRTDFSVPLSRGQLAERTLQLEEGRFITVRVTDGPPREDQPDPPPVEGADVVLVEEGLSAFPLEARTSKKGMAVLGPISEGVATVTARAEGFVPRIVGGDELNDDDVTIPLLRGGAIVGDVRDDRGFPIDGATIEVIGTDTDGMPIHETTDRSGLRDALFDFALAGPQPLIPRGELGVMPGPVPPIPRAGEAVPTAPEQGGEPWVSRADGSFRASPVTPGRVQLLVRHPEFVEGLTDVFPLAPGQEKEVHVVLSRGGRLEGRVVEEDRSPVVGARLEIAALEGTFEALSYTEEDGTFAAASVPKEILVSVTRPDALGEIAARLTIEVTPGRTTRVEIVLPKAREATTLRVVDRADFPISGAEVRVVSLDVEAAFARTFFSNDDGEVLVPSVRGLPLRVVLEKPGKASVATYLEDAGREHKLVMPDARSLKGVVTGRDGREKLEGADVTLYTSAGALHVRTDEAGEFEVPDLDDGRIRIVARHEGYAMAERVIAFVGDPRRATEIEPIDLAPAGSVEGLVLDDRDEPVVGARVGLGSVPTYLPVGRLPSRLARTDADGRFVLGGLPEGEITLEAYSPELGRGRAEGVAIRADRVTDRVVIRIPDQGYDPKQLKAAGSVALTLAERNGTVVVIDVPEGGEAEHAGIEPEDVFVTAAGRAVATLEQARDLLSGPLGEDVVIELARSSPKGDSARVRLRVRREAVRR
jgi:hypothetical protein